MSLNHICHYTSFEAVTFRCRYHYDIFAIGVSTFIAFYAGVYLSDERRIQICHDLATKFAVPWRMARPSNAANGVHFGEAFLGAGMCAGIIFGTSIFGYDFLQTIRARGAVGSGGR